MQTTLGHSNVRQGHGTPDGIGDMAGLEKARHASGIRLMRGLEISARPPCETEQRGSAATAEMVVFRGEVESPPRMLLGQAEFAHQQRVAGTMDGDCTRETAELLLVHDDHAG